MKRLLEWKQRMLQSPLTRKTASPKPMTARAELDRRFRRATTSVAGMAPLAYYSSDEDGKLTLTLTVYELSWSSLESYFSLPPSL